MFTKKLFGGWTRDEALCYVSACVVDLERTPRYEFLNDYDFIDIPLLADSFIKSFKQNKKAGTCVDCKKPNHPEECFPCHVKKCFMALKAEHDGGEDDGR